MEFVAKLCLKTVQILFKCNDISTTNMLTTRTEMKIDLPFVFSSIILSIYVLLSFVPNTRAIRCFECDSFDDFTCTELWDPELDVNWSFLNNCSHVAGAKYCIKMTGIYQVYRKYFKS